MTAKNKKALPKTVEEQYTDSNDWRVRKQNLEHRIKALRKIIEQLNEEGKDKKQ
jgi:predicted transposase YbfD/YdcC